MKLEFHDNHEHDFKKPFDPGCICSGKPMLLYIPAGKHVHCPSHPDTVIYSNAPMCELENHGIQEK